MPVKRSVKSYRAPAKVRWSASAAQAVVPNSGILLPPERRAFNATANEDVDEGSSKSVDEDFDQTQRPDRLNVVFRGVHFVHKAKLAHGERVCEEDVRDGEESLVK